MSTKYAFSNVDTLIHLIKNYVKTANIDEFIASKRGESDVGVVPLSVNGPTRDGPAETFQFAVNVTILAPTRDPMELLDESWGDRRWLVEISIAPRPGSGDDGNGHCFLMQVFIPVDDPHGVVVSWLNQIMINFNTHTQVTPEQCFRPKRGGSLPKFQWGTLFMQLYETISADLTLTTFAFPIQSSEPPTKRRTMRRSTPRRDEEPEYREIRMPVLGGLVDDAFVQYCGGPVVFSDYRRLMGLKPWYETFGFIMANDKEYEAAFTNQSTYKAASDSVAQHYLEYIKSLQACREKNPDVNELNAACQLGCENCADGSCMKTHHELFTFIGDKIKQNVPNACQWISDKPPIDTCLAKFNRHLNAQTMHLINREDGKTYDYVVRLKFYSLLLQK